MLFYIIRCQTNLGLFPWIEPQNLNLCIRGDTPVDQLCEYIGAMWRVDPACVSFYIGDEGDGINSSTMAGKLLAELPVPTRDDGLFVTASLNSTAQWSTRTLHMRDVVRCDDDDDESYHVVQHYVDPSLCWACGQTIDGRSGCLEMLCGHTHCGVCADALARDAVATPFLACRYCMLPTLSRGLVQYTHLLEAHTAGRLCNVRNCGNVATQACWCETVLCDTHAREHSDRLVGHCTVPVAKRGPGAFVPGLCVAEDHVGNDADAVCKGRLRYYCMTFHEAMCAHCGYGEKHASCGAGCHMRLNDPRVVADREAEARKAWATFQLPQAEERPEEDSSAAALERLIAYRDRILSVTAELVAAVLCGQKLQQHLDRYPQPWLACHSSLAPEDPNHFLCVRFVALSMQNGAAGLLRHAAKERHAKCLGTALSRHCTDFNWAEAWGVKYLTTDSLCQIVTCCPQLQHLNVSGCYQLTDAALHVVTTHCSQLQYLDVSGCNQLTDAALRDVAMSSPQLQHLNVFRCTRLTDASLREIATRCPDLRCLNVSCCEQLTDASVSAVATCCAQLQHLNVLGCNQLTDASFCDVATHCSQLQYLNVWGCTRLTDVSMREVASRCSKLQHLDVARCTQLTDSSMHEVATRCPQLTHLNVLGCRHLTDEFLRDVAAHCVQLKHLNISECVLITDAALQAVLAHCSQLQQLGVLGCTQLTGALSYDAATRYPIITIRSGR